ncbi:hypothetical protein NDI45_19500 [Leptolyngbya sp. GB1-A1]|uniref:hypothetical protein n=1 Tax=Leptolyngbya sp. GB1-A1 TaxID=2933908 RepID=UPI0032996C47
MGNKKKDKKKDGKKEKGIAATVGSVGTAIASVPSALTKVAGTAAHTTGQVVEDASGKAGQLVADATENTVNTAQAVIEKLQLDYSDDGKSKKKDKKDKKKNKKK